MIFWMHLTKLESHRLERIPGEHGRIYAVTVSGQRCLPQECFAMSAILAVQSFVIGFLCIGVGIHKVN